MLRAPAIAPLVIDFSTPEMQPTTHQTGRWFTQVPAGTQAILGARAWRSPIRLAGRSTLWPDSERCLGAEDWMEVNQPFAPNDAKEISASHIIVDGDCYFCTPGAWILDMV